jgi:ribosome-associated toxin RatA of RatAB toxin-antitoxin module
MPLRAALVASSLALLFTAPALADDGEAKHLEAHHDAVRYATKTVDPPSRIDTGGAAVFVTAPFATVRKLVTDYRHYERLIPVFEQARVLSKKAGASEVYLQVPVMHGAATIWAVARIAAPAKEGDGEAITARMVKGNVADFRAVWRLRPVDATHTILKLELLVDPNLPAPKSLVEHELQSAADRGVSAIREQAEALAKAEGTVAATPPAAPPPAPGTEAAASGERPNVARR